MRSTSQPVLDRPAMDVVGEAGEPDAFVTSMLVEVRTRVHITSENAVEIVTEKLSAAFENSGFEITVIPTIEGATTSSQPAEMRGEARLVAWTQDGTLVDGSQVEKAWGVKRQTVDAARERGEIFSIWVKNQHWYPREALNLKRTELAEINRLLGDVDPSSKLLFLLRKHGALSGKTPADAVAENRLNDVLRLAAEWARS